MWKAAAVLLALVASIFLLSAVCTTPRGSRSPAPDVAAEREAVYTVSGSADRVSLTLRNDTNGSEQREARVPYERALAVEPGAFLYISAQITSDSGSATCKITVDGVTVAEATARGFARIATCSARAP